MPGIPELQIHSAIADSIIFSWTVPSGSVVDRYQIIWEINQDPLVTFREPSLLPVSFNNYTVTGLQGYGDAIVSITVTAYNSAGSATSPSMNVAANFAAGNSECPNHQVSSTNSDSNDIIIGAVVGGVDILAVAVVVVAVLIYRYKSKSRKNQKKPVYK